MCKSPKEKDLDFHKTCNKLFGKVNDKLDNTLKIIKEPKTIEQTCKTLIEMNFDPQKEIEQKRQEIEYLEEIQREVYKRQLHDHTEEIEITTYRKMPGEMPIFPVKDINDPPLIMNPEDQKLISIREDVNPNYAEALVPSFPINKTSIQCFTDSMKAAVEQGYKYIIILQSCDNDFEIGLIAYRTCPYDKTEQYKRYPKDPRSICKTLRRT